MATTRMQHVTVKRNELDRLRRDSVILDWIEADFAARRPGGPSLRDQVGGLIDAGRSIDGILTRHVKRLGDRERTKETADR